MQLNFQNPHFKYFITDKLDSYYLDLNLPRLTKRSQDVGTVKKFVKDEEYKKINYYNLTRLETQHQYSIEDNQEGIPIYLRAEMTRVAARAIPAIAVTPVATPTFHRQIPAAAPPKSPLSNPAMNPILCCSQVNNHIDRKAPTTLPSPSGSSRYHPQLLDPDTPPARQAPTSAEREKDAQRGRNGCMGTNWLSDI